MHKNNFRVLYRNIFVFSGNFQNDLLARSILTLSLNFGIHFKILHMYILFTTFDHIQI